MIHQHLRTILWLRWRISYNQWRRAGILNAVLTVAFVWCLAFLAIATFFIALIGGIFGLKDVEPDHLLLLWDGIVCLFLFVWLIGLITELQRSELLSLDRLLHLPISLSGAFVLNFLSSLASFGVIMFLPGMIGLSIASVVTHGPAMIGLFPLVLTFMLLVTGVTYQLRGWLATLMVNKRRRRTIIMFITAGVILVTQIPTLINVAFHTRRSRTSGEQVDELQRKTQELQKQMTAGEIDSEEFTRRHTELLEQQKNKRSEDWKRVYNRGVDVLRIANIALPIGWLPYGASTLARGTLWPSLLGSLGMLLLGAGSLWRSYRATLRYYTKAGVASKPARKSKATTSQRTRLLLEATVPRVSEHAGTVTLATFQSLLRAPEGKMMLVTPLILGGVFGSMMIFGVGDRLPVPARPFIALGAVGMTLFGIAQLMINLFGLDRNGFRALVLMPAPRREILLGKNLAIAPAAMGLSLVILLVLQCFVPLRFTHFLATLAQIVATFLLFSLIGNMASIIAPVAISAGSFRPVQPKFVPMFLQMIAMMFAPLTLVPAAMALGAELLLRHFGGVQVIPFYLILSLAELCFVIWLYRRMLTAQGRFLQKREPRILEVVSSAPQ